MGRKQTDRQYPVQDNTDVKHKDVKMYCNTNKLPELLFCGPHSKPHGARGLSRYYHLRFDPKIGMGVYAIFRIPCACVSCTSMLEKHWISGIPPDAQECYKPFTKCNQVHLLVSIRVLQQLEHYSIVTEVNPF